MREFINRGVQLAESQGWQANIIRLAAGQQDAAVRAIRNGDLALVLLDEILPHSSLAHAMRAAKGKAICLGSPTFEAGVPCILNNPDEIFQSAVDYLRAQGHRDIMLVHQVSSDGPKQIQHVAWRHATASYLSTAEADARCIPVQTARYHCPTQDSYDAVREFLAEGRRVSAFLSFGDEITQGVLAAVRDSGLNVPEDISVLNVLDSPSMRFAHPPVSSVDVNFKRQFEIAFEILEAAQAGEPPQEKLYFVSSRIVERQSVSSVRSVRASAVQVAA
jgi:DNA-binding LacI/PurR family transcriptional regulator